MKQRMLNFEEAGAVLGCSPHTLRVWTRRGMVPHFKVGRRILFAVRDLQDFVNARRVDASHTADTQLLHACEEDKHG